MSVKKLDDGRYEVDIRPAGRNGKRIRRKFDKKSEAIASRSIPSTTITTKNGWRNRQISGICQS